MLRMDSYDLGQCVGCSNTTAVVSIRDLGFLSILIYIQKYRTLNITALKLCDHKFFQALTV